MIVKGGIPLWRLIVHDASKFSRVEFGPKYRVQILGHERGDAWFAALDHHHERNAHHWQYWVRDEKPVPMPETYMREMIADWLAAEKTYRIGIDTWFKGEYPIMVFHRETVEKLRLLARPHGIIVP